MLGLTAAAVAINEANNHFGERLRADRARARAETEFDWSSHKTEYKTKKGDTTCCECLESLCKLACCCFGCKVCWFVYLMLYCVVVTALSSMVDFSYDEVRVFGNTCLVYAGGEGLWLT